MLTRTRTILACAAAAAAGDCSAGGYYNGGGEQVFVVTQANGTWGTAEEVPGTAALNGSSLLTRTSYAHTISRCGQTSHEVSNSSATDSRGVHTRTRRTVPPTGGPVNATPANLEPPFGMLRRWSCTAVEGTQERLAC
jgi:hypothetical protein